jgi:hypothetical protein
MSKKDKNGNNHGGGRHQFVPSEQQRIFVASMAGFRMSWDEIAKVVIDERTGKSIARATLARKFKDELAQGKPKLKSLIQTKYLQRLNAGDWNAISFGMRHIAGYLEAIDPRYMLPSRRNEPPEPLDMTPDYSKPALPPPPERDQTPFGIVERPSGPKDWMR